MIVSTSHNFVFFHNPKTSGSSITKAIIPYCERIRKNSLDWKNDWHEGGLHMKVYPEILGIPSTYNTFAFVRNPFDIIVSMFAKNPAFDDFDDFVNKRAFNPPLIWNQSQLLLDLVGNSLVDYVFRFEDLPDIWETVCTHINIPYKPLEKENASNRRKDYRSYYSDFSREIIADIYKDDLINFGYQY